MASVIFFNDSIMRINRVGPSIGEDLKMTQSAQCAGDDTYGAWNQDC